MLFQTSVQQQRDLIEGQQPPLQPLAPGGAESWGLQQELLAVSAVRLPEGHIKLSHSSSLHMSLKPAGLGASGLTEMACKAAGMGSEASAKEVCSSVLIDTICLCRAAATAAFVPCRYTGLLVLMSLLACASADSC